LTHPVGHIGISGAILGVMMQRVPEPELMDDDEQAAAYAMADFGEVNQGFVDAFRERFPTLGRGRVLDLGCGPADIPIRLCRALPDVAVTAVDGAAAMLALGREAIGKAGLDGRIDLVETLLPSQVLPPAAFDAVMSNSLLHHLHHPEVLWRTILETAAPGAPVYVMDLARPASAEAARALRDKYAAGAPEVLQRDFLASLHAAFTADEVRVQLAGVGCGHWDVARCSDRHLRITGTVPAR